MVSFSRHQHYKRTNYFKTNYFLSLYTFENELTITSYYILRVFQLTSELVRQFCGSSRFRRLFRGASSVCGKSCGGGISKCFDDNVGGIFSSISGCFSDSILLLVIILFVSISVIAVNYKLIISNDIQILLDENIYLIRRFLHWCLNRLIVFFAVHLCFSSILKFNFTQTQI